MAPVARWLKTEVLETAVVNKLSLGFPRTRFSQGQVNPLKAEARLGPGQWLTPVTAEPGGGQRSR